MSNTSKAEECFGPFERDMPSVDKVIDFWRGDTPEWLDARYIGWGEPFCFGCGWLPPVPDGRKDSWKKANSWLDRAHLQDHWVVGDDSPGNIVMLCQLCHDDMPMFKEREPALEWVRDRARCERFWQMLTDQMWTGRSPSQVPSKNTVLRTRVAYLEAIRQMPQAV